MLTELCKLLQHWGAVRNPSDLYKKWKCAAVRRQRCVCSVLFYTVRWVRPFFSALIAEELLLRRRCTDSEAPDLFVIPNGHWSDLFFSLLQKAENLQHIGGSWQLKGQNFISFMERVLEMCSFFLWMSQFNLQQHALLISLKIDS